MKFTKRLFFAVFCFLPGLYAVIAWTINDLENNYQNWADEEKGMNRVVPFFGHSIKTKMHILLLLSTLGTVIVVTLPRGETKAQRKIRTLVLVTGILLTIVLCFAFM
jgi:hypothetical protein